MPLQKCKRSTPRQSRSAHSRSNDLALGNELGRPEALTVSSERTIVDGADDGAGDDAGDDGDDDDEEEDDDDGW